MGSSPRGVYRLALVIDKRHIIKLCPEVGGSKERHCSCMLVLE